MYGLRGMRCSPQINPLTRPCLVVSPFEFTGSDTEPVREHYDDANATTAQAVVHIRRIRRAPRLSAERSRTCRAQVRRRCRNRLAADWPLLANYRLSESGVVACNGT